MRSRAASRHGLDGTHRDLARQRNIGLLKSVAAHEHGAPAKELAREMGLPLPTAYHLLRTLVHEGYLRRENGLFFLDEAFLLVARTDGELGHESRDRFLAHLAICAKCTADADAQWHLKLLSETAGPTPPAATPPAATPPAATPPAESLPVRLQEPTGPSSGPDDHHAEGPHQEVGHAHGESDRSDPLPAELAAQAISALGKGAGTVFEGLDQLFRALGPPIDDHQELDRTQRSGEGGRR